MESHWVCKPLLRAGCMSSSRWQHKVNSVVSQEVLSLVVFCQGCFVLISLCVCTQASALCSHRVPCEPVCLCVSMCFLCLLPLFLLFVSFVLLQFGCFCFIIIIQRPACFLKRDRKCVYGRGMWGGSQRNLRRGTIIRKYYMKKHYFQ